MLQINRRNLTKFLKRIKRNGDQIEEVNPEDYDSQSSNRDYESAIGDENIDSTEEVLRDDVIKQESIKILSLRRNGQFIPMDIVHHLEYFFSTLI